MKNQPPNLGTLLIVGFLLAFAFSLTTTFVSANLGSRFEHRGETVHQQLAIWQGKPYLMDGVSTYFPAFQNRILFPLLLSAALAPKLGSPTQVFLILRLITAIIAFSVFWLVLTRASMVPMRIAALGLGMLAYVLVLTFNHGWEHPTDFLDVIFFSLAGWTVVSKNRTGAIALAVPASTNRESSPFIGVIWFMVHGVYSRRNLNVRETAWPVLLFAMLTPLAIWIWSDLDCFKTTNRRLLYAGIAIALIAPIFGIIKELPFFIPAAVILIFAVCCAERDCKTNSTIKEFAHTAI